MQKPDRAISNHLVRRISRRVTAERWEAFDETNKKLGDVAVEGGVGCFEPAGSAPLIAEELREIAEFVEQLTLRPV